MAPGCAYTENGIKYWFVQLDSDVTPLEVVVCVIVPQGDAVVVAVNTAPVPVGFVSTIVGGELAFRQPVPIPVVVSSPVPSEDKILDGTPFTDTIVPVTTQFGPPPVDVNGV